MNDDDRQRWRETMVAALYGELSPEEQARLEAMLDQDPGLRDDWEELNEARSVLCALTEDETWLADARDREHVFTPIPASWTPARPGWRMALASAAGFVGAALLFSGLMLVGLRLDRTPGGIIVRFGQSDQAEANDSRQGLLAGIPSGPGQDYVSGAELEVILRTLSGLTAARLDRLEQRQADAQAEIANALYNALSESQQRQYTDLRARIEYAALRSSALRPTVGGSGPWAPEVEEDRHGMD